MSLTHESATHLLERLRSGEVSAREVVSAHIQRIDEVNPAINAVVLPRFEEALEEAAAIDAATAREEAPPALAGLPVTVKECFDVVGLPTTAGVFDLPRPRPTSDAIVVARLRRAGAIVLGKTNLAQLSWALESENPVYGRTNNPWDLSRTPGGSSGGEGAIVATGGSAVGLGTDSGGSVRVPAHFCGVHGLKPTSGRLPDRGTADEVTFSFQSIVRNQPGLIARHVEDLRLVYGVLSSGQRRSRSPRIADESQLRVGYYLDDGTGAASAQVAAAVRRALDALEATGVAVEEFSPPGVAEAMEIFDAAFCIDAGSMLRKLLGASAADWRTRAVLDNMPARPLSASGSVLLARRAAKVRGLFGRAVAQRHLDAIVCPVTTTPAPRHDVLSRDPQAGHFTALYNLLGWPAGVVATALVDPEDFEDPSRPQHARTEPRAGRRLPVAVQVASTPWREDLVLDLMDRVASVLSADPAYPYEPPI